jgi:hypothetical protein
MGNGDEYETILCWFCRIRCTTVRRGTDINPKGIPIDRLGWVPVQMGHLCPVCAQNGVAFTDESSTSVPGGEQ